ncbi:hypothetical protein NSIN_20804 [Nitrosotalea sinensis]|uniref:HTH arsR-type domain-containing protein n=1 Tax=Nitrosotalea sinensis TaxID=1499975 RepID=A0A2H1EH85_9ARCH|nr:winged helix-turn-helix domain-containing protein [Candidatus Nitrosotalea sinensis]SHO45861.1 hypothetical protein NSIN_20804 [Candidatus Nitrosotalea sinensis]
MANDDDFLVKAEEHIEVISTEDQRIKIIGEELANDTGRAIFGKISQGVLSTNDIAKALDVSLPLVNWHINRLLGVGLIKVEKIELSSKNKQMKYYGPVKTAFVIVPPSTPMENNVSKSKKDAIFMQLRHYLAAIAAFVIVGPLVYVMEQNQSENQPPQIPEMTQRAMMKASESLHSNMTAAPFAVTSAPVEHVSTMSDPAMIVIAILGASAAFLAVFFGTRLFSKFRQSRK